MRKGIILAGGTGSRLHPLTITVSKQLMPVYDKPMIYYPLSTLMLAGIRDIMIITTPQDETAFRQLMGDGSQWGLTLSYATQDRPEGIAQAFLIAEDFIGDDPVCLILGDNIFYGHGLEETLVSATRQTGQATVFGYYVQDPERYGVVSFDAAGQAIHVEEKPARPRSNYAITGIYFYDSDIVTVARELKPSARGELEITDVNRHYLDKDRLHVKRLGRGTAWLDTGTHDALLDASIYIRVIEERQGLKVCCPEEIAYHKGFINAGQLRRLSQGMKNAYGAYLDSILQQTAAR